MSATYTMEELMATAISREIKDGEVVAVGTLSPAPAAGAILAKLSHAPNAELAVWMVREYWPFTEGIKEFFDLAQKGAVDLFFLGGAQIDQHGNTNLHVLGDYYQPKVRLPGGAGTGTLYYTVPRVMLFKADHNTRSFVEKVDFVTGAGKSPPEVMRRGHAEKCITPLCVFSYDKKQERLELDSIHPGIELQQVIDNTGFPLYNLENIPVTREPSPDELRLLRNEVKNKLQAAYPHFVKSAFASS